MMLAVGATPRRPARTEAVSCAAMEIIPSRPKKLITSLPDQRSTKPNAASAASSPQSR
jgi:hypothetical protein